MSSLNPVDPRILGLSPSLCIAASRPSKRIGGSPRSSNSIAKTAHRDREGRWSHTMSPRFSNAASNTTGTDGKTSGTQKNGVAMTRRGHHRSPAGRTAWFRCELAASLSIAREKAIATCVTIGNCVKARKGPAVSDRKTSQARLRRSRAKLILRVLVQTRGLPRSRLACHLLQLRTREKTIQRPGSKTSEAARGRR